MGRRWEQREFGAEMRVGRVTDAGGIRKGEQSLRVTRTYFVTAYTEHLVQPHIHMVLLLVSVSNDPTPAQF